MDVDDEVNHLTSSPEHQETTVQQREHKKKRQRNRKLQRHRRKLRKQGKLLETIASLAPASIEQSPSLVAEGDVPSHTGKHHSI